LPEPAAVANSSLLLRAAIFHTPGGVLEAHPDGALLIREGKIAYCGDYKTFPDVETTDLRGGFLLPGFVDAHVHFPQTRIIGRLGLTLLDWLHQFALPEEARMSDLAYATTVAKDFVQALIANGTTTALVFGSHFAPATAALFEQARDLRIISGLVLSDRDLLPALHQTPEQAYRESVDLIRRFPNYAVTPRFAVSCSEAMLEVCQTLVREHPHVRVHTHINEHPREIAEVARLFPWAKDYFGVYERFHLDRRAVLAHDVHATPAELERMSAAGVSIAHCPSSNAALASGIFPLRRHLDMGIHCALGTDIAAGTGFGMLKEALQAYLMQRVLPEGINLQPGHLLYLATLAGAEALGFDSETGTLEAGKSADFVYLRAPEHSPLAAVLERVEHPAEALSALIAMADSTSIREVRVCGRALKTDL
jgi:guanine deaminase